MREGGGKEGRKGEGRKDEPVPISSVQCAELAAVSSLPSDHDRHNEDVKRFHPSRNCPCALL